MAHLVRLPALGQTMEEGTIVRWMKAEGDAIQENEPLVEIMTDKANMEVEAPEGGTILKLLHPADATVAIQTPICIIGEPGEDISALLRAIGDGADAQPSPGAAASSEASPAGTPPSAGAAANQDAPPPAGASPESAPPAATASGSSGPYDTPAATVFHERADESPESSNPLMSTPRARKLAAEQGIDMAQLSGLGTGPQGRIMERDVWGFVKQIEEPPLRITPLAQRMAQDAGIEPREIVGSGPGGKIRSDDVRRATEPAETGLPFLEEIMIPGGEIQAPEEEILESTEEIVSLTEEAVAPVKGVSPPPQMVGATPSASREGPQGETQRIPLSRLRRLIAQNIAQSARTAPHVTLTTESDVTELVRLRGLLLEDVEKRHGVRLTYTDLIVRATALALREHPWLNSSFDDDAVLLHGEIHIGVAVAIPEGLVVPVLRDADALAIPEISRRIKELAGRARQNRLKPDELAGGTFTVTNLGGYGIDAFTPIINPPQCAILGVGRIARRPAFGPDGQVEARSFMNLCLSFDHRVIDGVPAAEFLRTLREMLEAPHRILI